MKNIKISDDIHRRIKEKSQREGITIDGVLRKWTEAQIAGSNGNKPDQERITTGSNPNAEVGQVGSGGKPLQETITTGSIPNEEKEEEIGFGSNGGKTVPEPVTTGPTDQVEKQKVEKVESPDRFLCYREFKEFLDYFNGSEFLGEINSYEKKVDSLQEQITELQKKFDGFEWKEFFKEVKANLESSLNRG